MSLPLFALLGILILLLTAAAFDRQIKELDKIIRSTHENENPEV